MKRQALALTLILALIFSALAVTQLTFLAKANFVFPPSNPSITMISPTNTTYATNNLILNVTIETYKTGYDGGPAYESTRMFSYQLDSHSPRQITITNASVAPNPGGWVFFEGSANITELKEGLHTLTVRVVFDYTYPHYHTESKSTVSFRIEPAPQTIEPPEPNPFPTTLVAITSVVSVALVGIGLLVYFKKRKRKHIGE